MSSTETCNACDSSGLPIVFTYHTVVANDEQLAPPGATFLKSHAASASALGLPPLTQARYGLRSLRPGTYLQLYHEHQSDVMKRAAKNRQLVQKPADRDPDEAHWEVLRVVPGGALMPAGNPGFATAAPFACTRDGGSHIYTTMTYRLADAHQATGLWVAVSANLWDRKLRNRNKKNAKVMQRIDIPKALGGGGPDFIKPEATWLNQHVADFALANLRHAGRDGVSPLATVKGNGQALVGRMEALAKCHPKTEGKGFIYVVADPVGAAEAAADIARARYQQGLDYSYSQRHPLGAASSIDFIHGHVYDSELGKVKQTFRPLKESDLYDAIGKPLFSASEVKFAPKPAEMSSWVWFGVMRYESFSQGQQYNKDIPKTARWLQLERQPDMGGVVAPTADLAQVRTAQATRKMDRLHNAKAAGAFKEQFQKRLETFNTLIGKHDADRAKLLNRAELKAVFSQHFDPNEPNQPLRGRQPGIVYMEEATKALIGWGGISDELAATIKTLIEAKPDGEDGWALRALIGNQSGLFSPMADFSENY